MGYYIVFHKCIIHRKNSDHSDFGQLQPGTVTSKESCSVGYLEKLPAFLILVKYLKIAHCAMNCLLQKSSIVALRVLKSSNHDQSLAALEWWFRIRSSFEIHFFSSYFLNLLSLAHFSFEAQFICSWLLYSTALFGSRDM